MRIWEVNRTGFTVADFLSWAKAGELELSPAFQRRPVWPRKAKSYLIDTIYKGLPIPVIFLRERTDISSLKTIREVVDGQQRLRTIISYIAPDKALEYLKDFKEDRDIFQVQRTHNKELAGKHFKELDNETKKRMLQYQFSVNVLPTDTDDSDVLKIFARMNSTGTNLNDQELRNAEYFGEFKETAYSSALEQLDRWKEWGIFKDDQIARMSEVELTSELFIFLMSGIQSKTQSSIKKVYADHDDTFANRRKIVSRFREVLDLIEESIGKEIRNTIFHRHTIFYALFACAHMSFPSGVKKKSRRSISEFRKNLKNASDRMQNNKAPEKVLKATQRRLGHKISRNAIVSYLMQIV